MKQSARRTIHLLLMLSLAVSIFVLTPGRALAGSVITVTLTGDRFGSGAGCSLREAIFAANHDTPVAGCAAGSGADTIVLAAGNYSLSLQGAEEDDDKTGDLDILAGLTIRGAGADQTVIAADQTFGDRIFDVNPLNSSPKAQVTIQGLKIIGGVSSSINGGGGIRNQAELTLQDMVISGNKVTSSTASSSGGGIKNAYNADLNIDHSTIAENTADYGGGIYNLGSLNINTSQIDSNTANFSGGGLKNDLGGTALIDGSSITSNESKSFDHAGAGIGNSSRLVVSNSSIEKNIGQGLYNDTNQPLLITGSTVSNNIGLGIRHTGGALSIYNTQIVANSSDGIVNEGNSLTLTDTSVSNNKGVGVRNYGSMSIDFTAILSNDGVGLVNTSNHDARVTNSTIAKNALVNLSDPSGIDNAGTLILQSSTIADNGGFGLKIDGASATVTGSIIARHPGGTDCSLNNGAQFISGGFNVVQNLGPAGPAQCVLGDHDLVTDPQLAADPGDHGGRTQTYAFSSSGSPAINLIQAGNVNCLPVDQRHFRRSDNGSGCDAGAFEEAAQLFKFMYYQPVIGRH